MPAIDVALLVRATALNVNFRVNLAKRGADAEGIRPQDAPMSRAAPPPQPILRNYQSLAYRLTTKRKPIMPNKKQPVRINLTHIHVDEHGRVIISNTILAEEIKKAKKTGAEYVYLKPDADEFCVNVSSQTCFFE
jgi:hypothetical protein